MQPLRDGGASEVPDLKHKQRKAMPKAVFAYVDARGEGHLPLNDESHIRNAMARWNQTSFSSGSAKESARRKIVSAARKHGIELSKDDKVAHPTRSLRAATTRRGPRGGRKTVRRKRRTTTAQRAAARRNIVKARRARTRKR
jgi:glutamyl/glutaminyl-tRNA synthetase